MEVGWYIHWMKVMKCGLNQNRVDENMEHIDLLRIIAPVFTEFGLQQHMFSAATR